MITTQKQQGAGFTLLEVLIGMSIMSVMMLLLFASLRVCVQSWNAGEKKIAQVSQAATVQAFLYNKLQMALPLEDASTEEKQFSFRGNAQQLQFVAAMPASAARLGLQLFKLSLVPAQDKQENELRVDIRPFFTQSDSAQWQEEQVVILDKIHSLRFAYFNGDEAEGNVGWQDEWLDKYRLPALLSVDIELINGELWPTIVVDLKVDTVLSGGGRSSSRNPFGIVNGKFTGR
ncbi:MAG: prepilin-type N-terminal cleavage/methylation domain-containing protein [Methylococcaceae bacterium]|nr:prepilin-type N-terminal cleavage/methylation domain-containing protein [Methylococcaceae bacterium]